MFYYEKSEDGSINKYTNNFELAKLYGWIGQTDIEPVMYQNKLYLKADYDKLDKTEMQSNETINETTLAVMEALAAQEERITKLEGSVTA